MAGFSIASLLISLSVHLIVARAQFGCVGNDNIDICASNNAADTDGGRRFDYAMGIRGALSALSDANIVFIPNQFHYGQDGIPYKPVRTINFTVEEQLAHGAVAITTFNRTNPTQYWIQFNAPSSDTFDGIKGVIFHESAHVWQHFGRGTPPGVIEGVADFIRLKAGLIPAHWVTPGGGQRWDQGYDVTARFLEYCTSIRGDFVWQMNARLANNGRWSVSIFNEFFGKSVDQLWKDYKNKYSG